MAKKKTDTPVEETTTDTPVEENGMTTKEVLEYIRDERIPDTNPFKEQIKKMLTQVIEKM